MNRRRFLTRLASAIAVPLFIPDKAIRSILDNRIVLSPEPLCDVLVPVVATIGPGGDFSNLQAWQEALTRQCPGGLDQCYTAELQEDVFEFPMGYPKTSPDKFITIRGGPKATRSGVLQIGGLDFDGQAAWCP